MLIFSPQSLVFIAVPKTGTTAVELALKRKADIIFARNMKHTTAMRFHRKIAPFLTTAYGLNPDRMAVMREPEEQIRSWYRYRCRDSKAGTALSTRQVSFNEFVEAVISDDPPHYAGIGSQWGMLTSSKGNLLVHHLFAHERPLPFREFLSQRFQEEIELKQKNVSPQIDAPLDPAVRARLRVARQAEFDLYDQLMKADGHLQSDIG